MNQNEQPMTQQRKYPGRDKVIFDPFAGSDTQEVSVGGPKGFVQVERKTYEVHRPCGHCHGTGRSKKSVRAKPITTEKGPAAVLVLNTSVASQQDLSCSQCLLNRHVMGRQATNNGVALVWGAVCEVFAFELTDAELNRLDPQTKAEALVEIEQHHANKKTAHILADQEATAGKAEVLLVVRHFA